MWRYVEKDTMRFTLVLITFLSFKDVEKLFKKFKEVKIGIEEFNYLDFKRKHSYWVITASK